MKVTLTKSVSKYGSARLMGGVSKWDTRGVHNNYCYEFLQESLDILGEEFEKKKLWVFFSKFNNAAPLQRKIELQGVGEPGYYLLKTTPQGRLL